ncbi:hypothetical protein C8F01DRAFT_1179975 [Mycena amicta]|nr:hypothetical protein C8F01DRAFT_1179975 [Mycena amicta]
MSIAIVDAAPFANPKRARHTCPDVKDTTDWASAIARARKFVAQLKIEEKVNVTLRLAPGVDIFGRCVWNAAVHATPASRCSFTSRISPLLPGGHQCGSDLGCRPRSHSSLILITLIRTLLERAVLRWIRKGYRYRTQTEGMYASPSPYRSLIVSPPLIQSVGVIATVNICACTIQYLPCAEFPVASPTNNNSAAARRASHLLRVIQPRRRRQRCI